MVIEPWFRQGPTKHVLEATKVLDYSSAEIMSLRNKECEKKHFKGCKMYFTSLVK